jgi:hypothetical protein
MDNPCKGQKFFRGQWILKNRRETKRKVVSRRKKRKAKFVILTSHKPRNYKRRAKPNFNKPEQPISMQMDSAGYFWIWE